VKKLAAGLAGLAVVLFFAAFTGTGAAAPVNSPGVTFRDVTQQAGIHFVHNNGAFGKKFLPETLGPGVAFIDYDNDGWPDIVKTNFSDDSNNLFHNDHTGEFTDLAGPADFGPVSIPFLGFGVKFLDIDNTGWKDLFVANGHVEPEIGRFESPHAYAERKQLLRSRCPAAGRDGPGLVEGGGRAAGGSPSS